MSAAGGALGVVLACWLLKALVAVAAPATPRLDEVRLDYAALLFAFSATALCGIVFASAQSHRLRRALYSPRTMDEILGASLALPRFAPSDIADG